MKKHSPPIDIEMITEGENEPVKHSHKTVSLSAFYLSVIKETGEGSVLDASEPGSPFVRENFLSS